MRAALAAPFIAAFMAGPLWAQDTGLPPADPVVEQPLPDLGGKALGLLPARATGLPGDLWSASSAEAVARRIEDVRGTGVPSARLMLERLMLAEAVAPPGDAGMVLAARIDALLELGSLDAAEAMLARAPVDSPLPEIAHLALDIAALTNRSAPACARLAARPGLSPGLAHTIWCKARHGEWQVAKLTLDTALALGQFDGVMGDHLLWFLDSEQFPPTTELPMPDPMDALAFALRESTGQTRPSGSLPLAWLDGDLTGNRTLRARLYAAEALARDGTLPASVLFAAYRAGTPAASGGIWGRAEAVQKMDAAIETGDMQEVLDALHRLDDELAPMGLRVAAAREFGASLGAIPVGEADNLMARYLLLDGRSAGARAWMPDPAPLPDRIALAIQSTPPQALELPPPRSDRDVLAQAILDAFTDPADEPFAPGTTGMRLLDALETLDAGSVVDSDDLRRALVLLRRAGQDRLARAIAVETLFLGERG